VSTATSKPSWTFLTNHARVLILIARDSEARLRDLAAICDVTERTVQAIVADLETAGYLTRERIGRRNRYLVTSGTRFRHTAEANHQIAGLLALINGPTLSGATPSIPDQQTP
jgi:DNA-binding MarR family transcriptional regulator